MPDTITGDGNGFSAQNTTGGVVSDGTYGATVKTNIAVPEFPAPSDAVHAMIVVPTGYVVAGIFICSAVLVQSCALVTHVGPTTTPTLSTAVT